MTVKWRKLIARFTIWLMLEIALTFLGLDDLADYSEYIFEQHPVAIMPSNPPALTT